MFTCACAVCERIWHVAPTFPYPLCCWLDFVGVDVGDWIMNVVVINWMIFMTRKKKQQQQKQVHTWYFVAKFNTFCSISIRAHDVDVDVDVNVDVVAVATRSARRALITFHLTECSLIWTYTATRNQTLVNWSSFVNRDKIFRNYQLRGCCVVGVAVETIEHHFRFESYFKCSVLRIQQSIWMRLVYVHANRKN